MGSGGRRDSPVSFFVGIILFYYSFFLTPDRLLCSTHGNAGCTLSPSAFGESLERELPEMKLGECNSLHSCRELSILARDTRQQPSETRDPLTRTSQTAKKARP